MREFFNGWRRKMGCITLVMALVLTQLWLRSYSYADALFVSGENCALVSALGEVGFCLASDEFNGHFFKIISVELERFPHADRTSGRSTFVPFVNQSPVWRMRAIGIQMAANPLKNQIVACASYLWIVPSLTLLSAYLILWKPRQRREPEHA